MRVRKQINGISADGAKESSDIYINFIPSIEYKLMKNLNFNTSYAVGLEALSRGS